MPSRKALNPTTGSPSTNRTAMRSLSSTSASARRGGSPDANRVDSSDEGSEPSSELPSSASAMRRWAARAPPDREVMDWVAAGIDMRKHPSARAESLAVSTYVFHGLMNRFQSGFAGMLLRGLAPGASSQRARS